MSFMPGWHSGDCASFVMRNYQGFEPFLGNHFDFLLTGLVSQR